MIFGRRVLISGRNTETSEEKNNQGLINMTCFKTRVANFTCEAHPVTQLPRLCSRFVHSLTPQTPFRSDLRNRSESVFDLAPNLFRFPSSSAFILWNYECYCVPPSLTPKCPACVPISPELAEMKRRRFFLRDEKDVIFCLAVTLRLQN